MGTGKKVDRVSLELPAQVLTLGRLLAAKRQSSHMPYCRTRTAEDAAAVRTQTDILLKVVGNSSNQSVRRVFGDVVDEVRLHLVAHVSWMMLAESAVWVPIADAVRAIVSADDGETLLRTRHIVGQMIAEGIFDLVGETESWLARVVLPLPSLIFLSGGMASCGLMTPHRAAALQAGKPAAATETGDPPTLAKPILKAGELHRRIRQRVFGLDSQIRTLATRLTLHMARAEMLKAKQDPQTGNECILVIGDSGTGKSFLCETAGAVAGVPFASYDCSAASQTGFVGEAIEDSVRWLIRAANGNPEAARYGMMFWDEFTKKAGRGGGAEICTNLGVQYEALRLISGDPCRQIGGKRGGAYERGILCSTVGMLFVLAGTCPGLDGLVERRRGRTTIGFGGGAARPTESSVLRSSLVDYGLAEEIVNRLTAILVLPNPTVQTLMQGLTASQGMIANWNRLLGRVNIQIALTAGAVRRLAEHGVEGGFYRTMRAVLSRMVEDVVYNEDHGTVEFDADAVRRAIEVASDGGTTATAEEGDDPAGFALDVEQAEGIGLV